MISFTLLYCAGLLGCDWFDHSKLDLELSKFGCLDSSGSFLLLPYEQHTLYFPSCTCFQNLLYVTNFVHLYPTSIYFSPNKYFLILQMTQTFFLFCFLGRITGMSVMAPSVTTVLFWLAAGGEFTGQGRIACLLRKNASPLHFFFFSWDVPWYCVWSTVRTSGGGQVGRTPSSVCRELGCLPESWSGPELGSGCLECSHI